MGKYYIRYLILWLPAVLASYAFSGSGRFAHQVQLFCAFFMVLGWAANTGMAAYHYPRGTLSALLTYTGFNILVIVFLYSSYQGSTRYTVLRTAGGILSFQPLDVLVRAIRPFTNLPHELVVTLFLIACCVIGYIAGLVQRRVRPNPYSPRMRRRA